MKVCMHTRCPDSIYPAYLENSHWTRSNLSKRLKKNLAKNSLRRRRTWMRRRKQSWKKQRHMNSKCVQRHRLLATSLERACPLAWRRYVLLMCFDSLWSTAHFPGWQRHAENMASWRAKCRANTRQGHLRTSWNTPTTRCDGSRKRWVLSSRKHFSIDFSTFLGAKIAGHRGYFLTNDGIDLNQALISYGLDFLRKKGYKKIQPPFFMNRDVMGKTAQLDQFDEELYKVRSSIFTKEQHMKTGLLRWREVKMTNTSSRPQSSQSQPSIQTNGSRHPKNSCQSNTQGIRRVSGKKLVQLDATCGGFSAYISSKKSSSLLLLSQKRVGKCSIRWLGTRRSFTKAWRSRIVLWRSSRELWTLLPVRNTIWKLGSPSKEHIRNLSRVRIVQITVSLFQNSSFRVTSQNKINYREPTVRSPLWSQVARSTTQDLRAYAQRDALRYRACIMLHCWELSDAGRFEGSRSSTAVYGRKRLFTMGKGVTEGLTQKTKLVRFE